MDWVRFLLRVIVPKSSELKSERGAVFDLITESKVDMSSSSPLRESPIRESSSDGSKVDSIVKHWFYEHTIDAKIRWSPFTFVDSQVRRS